ncbi:hypothetical protein K7G98_06490 [Saccharothrix sp. MB29]|nr:hypothetical protein [Saccharothrix sp. MB29]
MVWAGPADAPAVVVLDPAGVGVHGDLPATWRPLTGTCRSCGADCPRPRPARWTRCCASSGSRRAVHVVAARRRG